ncbi:fumarylacetoacetate hydrolase family protein [Nisaea sp.]|uniref:fumarylacetoacetate hydrolase family protein n=1 Tax=Nisaea sp. TaxID=2024842 RepID=UPI00329768B4
MSDRIARDLPVDLEKATLLGRVSTPEGPAVCTVRGEDVIDITARIPTITHALKAACPASIVRGAEGTVIGKIGDILETSFDPKAAGTRLLSPIDLQAIKAAGVTFPNSMIERVVEEMTKGDPLKADEARAQLGRDIGDDVFSIVPGSDEAMKLRETLLAKDLWSPYLEVGFGVDAEIFTKAQPMSSVGHGAGVGLHPRSDWNNPEPEVVLICGPDGKIVGATLGNDVNLRDFEGRSALLLGRAKDNNASSSLGPFIRLLDDHFTMTDIRNADLSLEITGTDGYTLSGSSTMRVISRDPEDLAQQMFDCHQYPDGAVLYTGTLFAPTDDRDRPGEGFTHKLGDVVRIASPRLGCLENVVGRSDTLPEWQDGALALFRSLSKRGIAL